MVHQTLGQVVEQLSDTFVFLSGHDPVFELVLFCLVLSDGD